MPNSNLSTFWRGVWIRVDCVEKENSTKNAKKFMWINWKMNSHYPNRGEIPEKQGIFKYA